MEEQDAVGELGVDHGKLGDHRLFVFNFDRQVLRGQNIARFLENIGEFTSEKTMLGVVVHPCLEETRFLCASGAAAIDEAFGDMADFRDVVVRRNAGAVWQFQAHGSVRMSPKVFEKSVDIHSLAAVWEEGSRGFRLRADLVDAFEELSKAIAREPIVHIEAAFF